MEVGRCKCVMNMRQVRDHLIKLNGKRCHYCGKLYKHAHGRLNVDHVKPKAKGGDNADDNMVVSCVLCNKLKGSKSAEEFMLFLQLCEANGVCRSGWMEFAKKVKYHKNPPERWKVPGFMVNAAAKRYGEGRGEGGGEIK